MAGQVPAGGSVLDLGAGVGRITHALMERGYEVVAVDESAEMPAEVRGARTVCCRIQDLRLERPSRGADRKHAARFLCHRPGMTTVPQCSQRNASALW
ncbi:class I SAM-dependent methyltransferase [Nonomuraea wenchangensis]|uniref:class I SAM-dependent methyltransferase n=1 Tax=Nonomuraea wenchangensis TaxID=568860 RepID=UPI003445F126